MAMHFNPSRSRQVIRSQVRQHRQALSHIEQHQASHDLVQHLHKDPSFHKTQHIALYLAFDGEIDTRPLIEYCWQQQKCVYLPILHPFRQGYLLFQAYTPVTRLQQNRFNIAEPKLDVTHVCPLKRLDIIFTPLVAFDTQGSRLGMGGGFYDRTLAMAKDYPLQAIGLAHNVQHYPQLPTDSWDIPLKRILTPEKNWCWR